VREAISRHHGQLTVAQAFGADSLGQRSTGDVHARRPVGIAPEPASPAAEEGLATSVLPGGVPATGALSAGAPGVHRHRPHLLQARLVFQEEAGAGPGIAEAALLSSPPGGPLSGPREVFRDEDVATDRAAEPEAVELPTPFSRSQGAVAPLREELGRGFQGFGLSGSGLQGATRRESPRGIGMAHRAKGGGKGAFLCRLEPMVSCARFP